MPQALDTTDSILLEVQGASRSGVERRVGSGTGSGSNSWRQRRSETGDLLRLKSRVGNADELERELDEVLRRS